MKFYPLKWKNYIFPLRIIVCFPACIYFLSVQIEHNIVIVYEFVKFQFWKFPRKKFFAHPFVRFLSISLLLTVIITLYSGNMFLWFSCWWFVCPCCCRCCQLPVLVLLFENVYAGRVRYFMLFCRYLEKHKKGQQEILSFSVSIHIFSY